MSLKLDLPESKILQAIHEEYDLPYRGVEILDLGADPNSAAYRLTAPENEPGFLKIRKDNFEESSLLIPDFLRRQGVDNIIAPVQTRDGRLWTRLGEFKLLLYPFIQGKSADQRPLSDRQRIELGAALARIHSLSLPDELAVRVTKETYSPRFRRALIDIQHSTSKTALQEPVARKLAELITNKRDELSRLIQRAGQLAGALVERPLPLVLCHSDLHAWNILVDNQEHLYIVDWDNPILAPRERDLMFIGAGIDRLWTDEKQEALFYDGYGLCAIDHECLAYYRYERIIQDLVAFSEELSLSEEGEQEREQAYRFFASNFEPGGTIEMADKAWQEAASLS